MISEETRKESYDSLDKENRYNLILEALDIPKTAKEIAIELYKNKKIMDKERNATAPRLTELLKKRKSKSDRKKDM